MNTNETDIARKIQKGDFKAFEMLFREYYPVLKCFALKYVTNEEVSEELVQEIFYNIWAKHSSFNVTTSVKGYLFKTTHNSCLQYFKRKKLESKYQEHVLSQPPGFYNDPSEELKVKELNTIIDNTLQSLPERCRKIFRLSKFDGLKYHEIAEKLSISIKTVEANMGKALKQLRFTLKDYVCLVLVIFKYIGL